MSEDIVEPNAEVRIFLDENGELQLQTTPEDFHPALINLWLDMVKSSILTTFKVPN